MRSSVKKTTCVFCSAKIQVGSFCPQCGNPTEFASNEERTRWDLEHWLSSRSHGDAEYVVTRSVPSTSHQIQLLPLERANGHSPQRVIDLTESPPVVEMKAPSPPKPRPAKDKSERARMSLVPGETVAFAHEGRCGFRRVTLVLTTYRIAIAGRSRVRWYPLEEVSRLVLDDRHVGQIVVEAWISRISFRGLDAAAVTGVFGWLSAETALARRGGGFRHHPDVIEEWMQLTTRWRDSPLHRLIQRHPALRI